MIGIFPGLSGFDGIGASGLSAWKALGGDNPATVLLSYGPSAPSVPFRCRVLHARTTAGAAFDALRSRFVRGPAIFWHLHLLRLLPLIGTRRKVVLFLHGIEAWRPVPKAVAAQMSRVNLILVNSHFTWERFLQYNPRHAHIPHRVVPLGIGESAGTEDTPPGQMPVALMIGRIVRSESYKGHDAVIAAWPAVLEKLPDAQLHIIGGGDLLDELRRLAHQLRIQHSVHVHGAVSEDRKSELIRRSRCMALPSRGEGFGLAYIESMRLGRPCLVSQFDAGREVVNPPETGLAADPANRVELTEALVRLLSRSSEWDAWSRNAFRRYSERYTESHFQTRLRAAVAEIL